MAIEGLNFNQPITREAGHQGYNYGFNPFGGNAGTEISPKVSSVSTKPVDNSNIFERAASTKYSVEDYETAEKFINQGGLLAMAGMREPSGVSTPVGLEGKAYEGFTVGASNGTGELQPDTRDLEKGQNLYRFG